MWDNTIQYDADVKNYSIWMELRHSSKVNRFTVESERKCDLLHCHMLRVHLQLLLIIVRAKVHQANGIIFLLSIPLQLTNCYQIGVSSIIQ